MMRHLEPYRLLATYAWYYQRNVGGRILRDPCPYMLPLWQQVGREVRGPRWLMLCFYQEVTAFWHDVIEWTEEGRN